MRRRYFSYSLRTLLVVFTIAAVYLGLQATKVAKQRKALGIIEANGGTVFYDYDFDSEYILRQDKGGHRTASLPGPSWLHAVVGEDYFRTVVNLSFENDIRAGDKELRELSKLLPHLRSLWLSRTQVTDDGLRHLLNLKRLEALSLDGTNVGDNGMLFVGQCTGLRNLQLTQTRVTDAGLRHLTQLRNLEKVGLSSTDVTDKGVEYIWRASPKKLKWLNLNHTKTTDSIVARLTLLPMLEFVNVRNTGVSVEGVLKLKETFPSCRVLP